MRCATWKCFSKAVWLIVEHLCRGKCEIRGYCEKCLKEISVGKIIKKWKVKDENNTNG